MITYDGLRVLIMAEDDSRRCFGLFGPPSQSKNLKIRPRACFFIARLMVMLLDVEIQSKSRKITKHWIFKNHFFENLKYRQDRCPDVFFGGSHPRNTPEIFQKYYFHDFSKRLGFFFFFSKKLMYFFSQVGTMKKPRVQWKSL